MLRSCAYCGSVRGVHSDHVIPASVRRNRLRKMSVIEPHNGGFRTRRRWVTRTGRLVASPLLETVPACSACNIAKGTRLLIPPSWADRVEALEALGIGKWRIWNGDTAELRTVHK